MDINQKDQKLYIGGEVTVGTLTDGDYRRFQAACHSGITAIDFGGVTRADSACVALLLSALRAGVGRSAWQNVPESVHALAQLYEVEEVL